MKKLKKTLIIIVVIALVALTILATIAYRTDIENNNMEKSAATIAECSIEMKENYTVLVKFNNQAGIKEIKYPSGDVITCNGKKSVGVDLKVSKNGKYEYTLKDINNVEKKYTVYAPGVHVELTKNDINIDLESAKNVIKNNLVNSLVATYFVNLHVVEGERKTVDSSTTPMQDIINNWTEIGSSGKWKVVTNKDYGWETLVNTANQNTISGFISPETNYTDIDFSFSTSPRDNDNDIIGMLRQSSVWLG